jgi:hypothetical protein
MTCALSKVGAEDMVTPREIIRDFLTLLNILRDNSEATFNALLRGMRTSDAPRSVAASAPCEVTSDIKAEAPRTQNVSQKKNVTIFDIDI